MIVGILACLAHLGADLVAALAGLDVHDLPHAGGGGVLLEEEEDPEKELGGDRLPRLSNGD